MESRHGNCITATVCRIALTTFSSLQLYSAIILCACRVLPSRVEKSGLVDEAASVITSRVKLCCFDLLVQPPLCHPVSLTHITTSAQTGSLRNFSLPRERCLDVVPPVSTRATPVPPQYIATGIISSAQHDTPPLPTPPLCSTDDEVPSPTDQQIEDFVVQPLDIRKIQKRKSQTLYKLAVNQERLSEPLAMDLTVEAGSNISFFPDISTNENKTFTPDNSLFSNVGPGIGTGAADLETSASPFDVNYANNTESAITCFSPSAVDEYKSSIATGAAVPTSQDAVFGPTESKVLPLYKTVSPSEVPQAPRHSATSAIPIEESTPVIPPVVGTSSLSPTKLATIRLVDSYLEMPQEVDHASLVRKWKGQRSFISF